VSEVDGEEIGREEIVGYTGKTNVILTFDSPDWLNVPPTLLYSLQFPSIYFTHLNQSEST